MDGDFLPFLDRATVPPVAEQEGRHLTMRFDMATLQSSMSLDDPTRLELEYTRAMMLFLLFNAAPDRILMIGLGGGSLPKYCHRHLPQAHITVVEINPHVIAMREQFQVPPDGPRFRVVHGDGARFMRANRQRFDVVLVDAFHFDGQPEALGRLAFYRACRDAVGDAGVLVVNLDGDPEASAPLLARLGEAFGGGVWSMLADGGSNRIAFAADPQRVREVRASGRERLAALDPVHQATLNRRSGETALP
jgi:spermidine synthase